MHSLFGFLVCADGLGIVRGLASESEGAMTAAGFAAGAALQVVGGREHHQVSFEVIVFGFKSRSCGGMFAVHSYILSFLRLSCVRWVRQVRWDSIV